MIKAGFIILQHGVIRALADYVGNLLRIRNCVVYHYFSEVLQVDIIQQPHENNQDHRSGEGKFSYQGYAYFHASDSLWFICTPNCLLSAYT